MKIWTTHVGTVHSQVGIWAIIGVDAGDHVAIMARMMRPNSVGHYATIRSMRGTVRWNQKEQPPFIVTHYARLVALTIIERRNDDNEAVLDLLADWTPLARLGRDSQVSTMQDDLVPA